MTVTDELARLAEDGEREFDRARFAGPLVRVEHASRRARNRRRVGSWLGVAGSGAALTVASVAVLAPPAAPPSQALVPASSVLEVLLSEATVPWDGETPGQRMSECTWLEPAVTDPDPPVGWNGNPGLRERAPSNVPGLECHHTVLPGEDIISASATIYLDSKVPQARVEFSITNVTESNMQINGLSPTAVVYVPSAADRSTLMGVGTGEEARGWNVSIYGSFDTAWDPLMPVVLSDSVRQLGPGETAMFTFLVRDRTNPRYPGARLLPELTWIPDALESPDRLRVDVSVQFARGFMFGIDEGSVFDLDVGEIYLDDVLVPPAEPVTGS